MGAGRWRVLVPVLGFLALGAWLDAWDGWDGLAAARRASQSREVPAPVLDGKLGRILRGADVVHPVPNDGSLYERTSAGPARAAADTLFRRKREVGHYLLRAGSGRVADGRADLQPDKLDQFGGIPILSVVVDPADLYDPSRGIIENEEGRGMRWERLASISLYDEHGTRVFATPAGIRLHGGFGRKSDGSFRFYFRERYGAPTLPAGLLFPGDSRRVLTLVARAKSGKSMPFTTALGFEFAQALGARVPRSRQAVFFLNGQAMGVYTLAEHLSERQWRERLGHDDFLLIRYRGESDLEARRRYAELEAWVQDRVHRMDLTEADRRVDVEALSRHLLSFMFCGTSDWRQGLAVLDETVVPPRWYWVNWDMDDSFKDFNKRRRGVRATWRQEAVELITAGKHWHRTRPRTKAFGERDVRSALFTRLWRESGEYREFFRRLVMDALNHEIPRGWLAARIEHYRALAEERAIGSRTLDEMTVFVRHRPAWLRSEMQRYFGAGRSLRVRVLGDVAQAYTIDGYAETAGYEGWYFGGEVLTVAARDDAAITGWRVNGDVVEGAVLEIDVHEQLLVEPVIP